MRIIKAIKHTSIIEVANIIVVMESATNSDVYLHLAKPLFLLRLKFIDAIKSPTNIQQ